MAHSTQPVAITHRVLRRVVALVKRFEWFDPILQYAVRAIQPRFTMGVMGVLLDETGTRVLVVEHVYHFRMPWGLPGGWLDRGEEPVETVVREFREETGLRVRPVLPLVVARGRIRGHMDLVYLVEAVEWPQTITLCDELYDFAWVAFDHLPSLSKLHVQAITQAVNLSRSRVELGSNEPLGAKTEA